MTSCNGLSKDTKPPNKDVVTPCVVVETQLTHPKAAWLVGPNLVEYVEPDENGRPLI